MWDNLIYKLFRRAVLIQEVKLYLLKLELMSKVAVAMGDGHEAAQYATDYHTTIDTILRELEGKHFTEEELAEKHQHYKHND